MTTTWVVVADEAIARILQRPLAGRELESVEEMTDAAAHADGADLRRDAHGRRAGSATAGDRQNNAHRLTAVASVTASAGEDEQRQEAAGFARRVADRLAHAHQQRHFEELRIIAAPRFLGLLRQALNADVARAVREEIDKDLIHMSNRDITERLFAVRVESAGTR
ncbi:MAG: host attachment protein [Rubrivivax sp.]|nr:MAG: host attachment protein [Rubrivivax sp.]